MYSRDISWSFASIKKENNRPSSVNLKPLVHKHNKAGNKYHTQENTDTGENPSV